VRFNTQILSSLLIIGLLAVVTGSTTMALFNDTETSIDNTFTAGALDLEMGWNESYNGELIESQELTNDPGPIFDLPDLKPGDVGEATLSFHIYDNPGYVYLKVNQTEDADNSCTEPEANAENGDCGTDGELPENINLDVWYDDGDNERQPNETLIFNGTAEEIEDTNLSNGKLLDSNHDTEEADPFPNSTTQYLGFAWDIPGEVGNVIQTDSTVYDINLAVEQARHQNENEPGEENETSTPEPEEENVTNVTNETRENVTVNVMKHICDDEIQSVQDFNQVDGPDANTTTEFHDKVLACPTVVREGDNYTNGTAAFDSKEDFDFTVTGADGEQQTIEDAAFKQGQVPESAIGVDVNGDGDRNDSLDTSLYAFSNVSSGNVSITETEAPNNTRSGALAFTPSGLAPNDDASTLLENLSQVFADDDTIELDTTRDTQDNEITLHVYNFQDRPVNVTPPVDTPPVETPPTNDTDDNVTDDNETTPPVETPPVDTPPVEQDEGPFHQVDFVGGEPIENLSETTYYHEERMIRWIHGNATHPVTDQVESDQVKSDQIEETDCIDSRPIVVKNGSAMVNFTVHDKKVCAPTELSLVSYVKPFPGWVTARASEQALFDSVTRWVYPGNHSMIVDVPA
jgi:predicted ribosomally synthesized peptide with SipW-like signal peptide